MLRLYTMTARTHTHRGTHARTDSLSDGYRVQCTIGMERPPQPSTDGTRCGSTMCERLPSDRNTHSGHAYIYSTQGHAHRGALRLYGHDSRTHTHRGARTRCTQNLPPRPPLLCIVYTDRPITNRSVYTCTCVCTRAQTKARIHTAYRLIGQRQAEQSGNFPRHVFYFSTPLCAPNPLALSTIEREFFGEGTFSQLAQMRGFLAFSPLAYYYYLHVFARLVFLFCGSIPYRHTQHRGAC